MTNICKEPSAKGYFFFSLCPYKNVLFAFYFAHLLSFIWILRFCLCRVDGLRNCLELPLPRRTAQVGNCLVHLLYFNVFVWRASIYNALDPLDFSYLGVEPTIFWAPKLCQTIVNNLIYCLYEERAADTKMHILANYYCQTKFPFLIVMQKILGFYLINSPSWSLSEPQPST